MFFTVCFVADVHCGDETRVRLRRQEDYIHASYVDGFTQRKEYICTQGPVVSAVEDFWLMVWQENCYAIVMLCQLLEEGKQKCAAYWNPQERRSFRAGQFIVRTLSVEQLHLEEQRISISSLQLMHDGDEARARKIVHYAHLNWPDKATPAVPAYPSTLLMDFVRRDTRQKTNPRPESPIVIHCSAGIGRTGTLVAIDICLQRFRLKNQIDVEAVVRKIREQRIQAVQTEEQYVYIYKALLEHLKRNGYECSLEKFFAQFASRYTSR